MSSSLEGGAIADAVLARWSSCSLRVRKWGLKNTIVGENVEECC